MRIFIIGASGFLGKTIYNHLKDKTEITGSYFTNFSENLTQLDIRNKDMMDKILTKSKLDVVIHSGSLRIDMCEKNHMLAQQINVDGTRNLVDICKKHDIHLIYISSDAIFDGTNKYNNELTIPNPLGIFGKTKIKSESIITQNLDKYCILRTSLLFGWDKRQQNFAQWIIQELSKNKPIQVISDQIVSPSYCNNMSDIVIESAFRKINGLFHAAGMEKLTRVEFALKIAHIFSLDCNLIIPTSMSELNLDMKRGHNCSLEVIKLKSVFKTPLLSLDDALFDMYKIKDLI